MGLERTGEGEAEGVGVRHGDTREEAVGFETGPETGSASGEGLERASGTKFLRPGV